jgi:hypothetical protein
MLQAEAYLYDRKLRSQTFIVQATGDNKYLLLWHNPNCYENYSYCWPKSFAMEQHTIKNVNNYLNTNIYSYLERPGVQVLIYI